MKRLIWIFLAACALSISSAANATPGDVLITRESGVEVLDAPSYAGQVVITLAEGRKLKELRRQGPWVKVIVYGELGKDGWVHGSRVATESAEAELAAQPDVSAVESEAQAEISPAPEFTLVLTGTPGQLFRVRCQTVDRELVRRTTKFLGRLPNTSEMEGIAVRCRVHRLARHAGTLAATLYRQGRSKLLGAAQTRATDGCLSVRSKGRWGKAYGREECAHTISW
jgi:hypothetical protein